MITFTCPKCQKEIKTQITLGHLKKWRNTALIQDAMPDIPIEEREMLISGYCKDCWKELFGDPNVYQT